MPRISTPANCGTYGGYTRHMRDKEPSCQPCRDARMERLHANLDAKYPSRRRHVRAQCGTTSGYNRHRLDKTPICDQCALAWREIQQEAYAKRTEEKRKARLEQREQSKQRAECGTVEGITAHYFEEEPMCLFCRQVQKEYRQLHGVNFMGGYDKPTRATLEKCEEIWQGYLEYQKKLANLSVPTSQSTIIIYISSYKNCKRLRRSEMEVTIIYYGVEEIPEVKVSFQCEENDSDKTICEKIFRNTNLYEGPIWDIIEPILPKVRSHTALSIGDKVVINDHTYECAFTGFEEVA